MNIQNLKLNKLNHHEPIPFELLLLADESEEAIAKYIYDSVIYILYKSEDSEPIGIFALYKISESVVEIKNIGVVASFRGQGIGSYLLNTIENIAFEEGYDEIIVGTPISGTRQIRFYEKNDFRKYTTRKNFFIENYSEPIYEDGVMLKDMIVLRKKIQS